MKLTQTLSEVLGQSFDCEVPGCDGHVRAENWSERIFGINAKGRPWLAEAPGSDQGYVVCREHDYNGEYIAD